MYYPWLPVIPTYSKKNVSQDLPSSIWFPLLVDSFLPVYTGFTVYSYHFVRYETVVLMITMVHLGQNGISPEADKLNDQNGKPKNQGDIIAPLR